MTFRHRFSQTAKRPGPIRSLPYHGITRAISPAAPLPAVGDCFPLRVSGRLSLTRAPRSGFGTPLCAGRAGGTGESIPGQRLGTHSPGDSRRRRQAVPPFSSDGW